jgi:hypothetical protein
VSITRHHVEWLTLVPNSGPFLSLPVLAKAFPQGLDAYDAEHSRRLRLAFEEWDDDQSGKRPDRAIHRQWIKLVLSETLGFEELLTEGQAIPQTLRSEIAECGETLRPDWVVNDPTSKKARLLVQTYPRSQPLTKPVQASRWKVSPDTRMMQLLHDTGIRLGLVTNGDHWMLVNAPKNETTGYASWYSSLWFEEQLTLRAFRTLLGAERLFGVAPDETLESLLDRSAADQQDVTDQLGYQVRKAVEVLIQALDRADQDHGRKLLAGVDERVLYESALTVMMRLVFLFCAEERELLLLGDDLYDKNYAVSTLREQLREAADQHGEEILGLRHDAWPRLLTSFRAVYAGVKHDRMKLPAYGGSLFNPDRFPFLEGRLRDTNWKTTEATPLPVNNRTILHLLESLQLLEVKMPGGGKESRALSFRSLDIEQIGHVYEGLLDHTAKRATEPMLGLHGTRDKEPEVALAEIERLVCKGEKDLVLYLKDETGRSESALKKALKAEIDDQLASRFRTVCQDPQLWKRIQPLAGLVRLDTVDYPVVITKGSVFVTSGTDRRSSGTHYTPKSLTEPIVQYTLEPLVYIGPADGLPKEQWKLRSAKELLQLKICDMACGSGAFLVQVCRFLATRLLEAWDDIQRANPGKVRITPEGEPSTGRLGEMLIPDDQDERLTYALRIVAQRCIYGVDKNPIAVEMAKLSLWLLTLAKDKPFEFLDHAIRCGDSLVGIHNLDQLRKFNLEGTGEDNNLFLQFLDPKIREAISLRRQITEIQANTVEDVDAQDSLLREANEKIERLKSAADFLIAAEFRAGSADVKVAARDDAGIKVAILFNDSDLSIFRREAQDALAGQATFHWCLEFPEVMVERGGFNALVGNPPFMGGQIITNTLGNAYRAYLVASIAQRRKGSADLCSYFLLRALGLGSASACFGFIATNTIAEGETRLVGLDQLVERGASLYSATPTQLWPGDANLIVSLLWFARKWSGTTRLNGSLVARISTELTAVLEQTGVPNRLRSNRGWAFKGSSIQGSGFLLAPSEAEALIRLDPKYADILFPYLIGEEVANHPEGHAGRWAINFFDWQRCKAEEYPECFRIVMERVKPQREKLGSRNTIGLRRAQFWWRYDAQASDMYEAISGLKNVWAAAAVSKYVSIIKQPVRQVFSHNVVVFPTESYAMLAVLASAHHVSWVMKYSSSFNTSLRYTVADGFDTYPFPPQLPIKSDAEAFGAWRTLATLGASVDSERKRIMLQNQEGLTKTYNRLHNADENSAPIEKLRQLHTEMDNAVSAAYGWTNLDLNHGFYDTKQGVRYTISESARREVLARLLSLNHERYSEELSKGLHEKKKGTAATKGRAKKDLAATRPTPSLFVDPSFPSTPRDKALCAVALQLVSASPGLPWNAYLDGIVLAVQSDICEQFLVGNDRQAFNKVANRAPAELKAALASAIPARDIRLTLLQNNAIQSASNNGVIVGSAFASVASLYPSLESSFIALVDKAAQRLRELQESAAPMDSDTRATVNRIHELSGSAVEA